MAEIMLQCCITEAIQTRLDGPCMQYHIQGMWCMHNPPTVLCHWHSTPLCNEGQFGTLPVEEALSVSSDPVPAVLKIL